MLFEDAAEMGHVAVADQRGNVMDATGGVGQQLLGALHPQGVDDVQKALLQVTVDELGQVPLTDVDVVGYVAVYIRTWFQPCRLPASCRG